MSYLPIEQYGLIGNMRTAALVGTNGSIDWFCYPSFDAPSVFGALLDERKGGRFQIAPVADRITHKQLYLPESNVLLTRFLSADGVGQVVDFMPVGRSRGKPGHHALVRQVTVVRGSAASSASSAGPPSTTRATSTRWRSAPRAPPSMPRGSASDWRAASHCSATATRRWASSPSKTASSSRSC